jgi:HlyD family secretion protein
VSRRTKIIIGVVVLVVIGGVVAALALGSGGSGPQIDTATVTKQDLAVTVTASGKVEAGVSADVFPPTQGTLSDIYVADGTTVTAGQKIAQMDTRPLELQVKSAKAALKGAQAQLNNADATGGSKAISAAKAGVTAAYASLTAAEAQQTAAKMGWDNAKAAYDAASLTLPSGSPTLTGLAAAEKQAYAGYQQAKAGVSQAKAGIKSAESGLASAKAADQGASIAAAKAGVTQAAEALTLAEQTLSDATLVAPIDGVLVYNGGGAAAAAVGGGSKPTEGSAVSPAGAPFTVVDLAAVKFTAEVDEADIERVTVGMDAEVTLDAFPGEVFKTRVVHINPQAQPTATGGTVFNVELSLDDTSKDILIGMKGDGTIKVSSTGSTLTIPVEALFSEGGTDFVYAVEGTKLKKTKITAGATTDTEVEVVDGLTEGQKVALSGSTQYTDGMTVRVKP